MRGVQFFRRGVAVAALAGMVLVSAGAGDALAARKFLTIGTAGLSGVYYPVGGAICRVVNRKKSEHGITCSVQSTGGSIENLNSVRSGDVDMAFSQSDWQTNAYLGTGVFSDMGANKDLRSVMSLHGEAMTLVARADAGIRSLDDLKGKRVNIGNPGSGMRATMEEVMRAKGWDMNIFSLASELRSSEQAQKLCDNQIDAFVFASGHPNGSVQEVSATCDTHIIDFSGPAIEQLMQEHEYYAPAVIPGGMYPGTPRDVQTFGVRATLVASAKTDPDMVYQLVKAVFENFDRFKTAHPILSTLHKEQMVALGLTAPLHEGAKRYYREIGLLKD
jgi:TRAP transporter TAXI family solute receptor